MTTVALYARLSRQTATEEDEGPSDSVANQLSALRTYAEAKGYSVYKEYSDDGVSGFSGVERDGFGALLADLPNVDRILVRHADRLERNPKDAGALHTGCALHGVSIETLDGAVTDPGTSTGGLTSTMLSALAHYESRVKSERLKMSRAAQRANGTFITSRRMFGYNGATVIEEEARWIRWAYQQILDGGSVESIRRRFIAEGIPQVRRGAGWQGQQIRHILNRARNAGLMEHQGQILEGVVGQWEPIVTPETFYAVQAILKDPARRTTPGPKPVYLTSRIARCGVCGKPLVASRNSKDSMTWLKCVTLDKGGKRHSAMRILEADAKARDAAVAALFFGTPEAFSDPEDSNLIALVHERQRLTEESNDILDLHAEGLITLSQRRERLTALKARREALESRIEALQDSTAANAARSAVARDFWTAPRQAFKDAAKIKADIAARFDALEVEKKRALVASLVDITVNPGPSTRADKVVIEHRVVTSLNEPEWAEEEERVGV